MSGEIQDLKHTKLENYMPNIPTKARKELWGKAAGRCSICNRRLTLNDDCHTNISNECHIVSEKKNGPRHIEGLSDYNSYDNLILLCRNHHAEVDTNVNKYTIEELKKIKRRHEKNVDEQLKSDNIVLMVMSKINNGREFGDLLWGCHSFDIFTDVSTESLIRVKDELYENIQNLLNIQDELSLTDKNNIYEDLDLILKRNNSTEPSISMYASVSQTHVCSISTRCIKILLSQTIHKDVIVLDNKKRTYE